MSDLIPLVGGKPWEVIPNAEKTIAEQAARIAELEARLSEAEHTAQVYRAGNAPLEEKIERLEGAVNWALGCGEDFPQRQDGQGNYYWRHELAERAGLVYNGTRYAAIKDQP